MPLYDKDNFDNDNALALLGWSKKS